MNYKEAREYITEKEKLGSVMGLDTIRELLDRLGNPETQAPVIHIAGTNGKGSILAFVEETLVEAGMNVGAYWYFKSLSETESKNEAHYCVNTVSGKTL